jgi:hypothetical protein
VIELRRVAKELHVAATVVADALEESLQHIGIRFFDHGGDNRWFSRERLDFPAERG